MEQLKKLIKKIAVCALAVASVSQTLIGEPKQAQFDPASAFLPDQTKDLKFVINLGDEPKISSSDMMLDIQVPSTSSEVLPASGEKLPQGPELPPAPGIWSDLRSSVETRAEELKSAVGAGLSAGWQATKAATTPFLRRQTLKILNMVMPNSEQQIRTIDNALKTSSSYVKTIREALAIPENPSVEELDAQIANLRKELAALKAQFPLLEKEPVAENSQTIAPKEQLAENIPQDSYGKRIAEFENKKSAINKSLGKENSEIEETIKEIEAADASLDAPQASTLRYQLKNALETGNLNIDLFTPEQLERTGLVVDRIQMDKALQKNKERGKVVINSILDAQANDASRAAQLKSKLEADLMSGAERIKTFGLSQLKKIGFDEAMLAKIEQKEKQRLSFGLGGYGLQAKPSASSTPAVTLPKSPVIEGLD